MVKTKCQMVFTCQMVDIAIKRMTDKCGRFRTIFYWDLQEDAKRCKILKSPNYSTNRFSCYCDSFHLIMAEIPLKHCTFYFHSTSEAGSDFSLFEALRDSIYSEVATLISLNESRPHFLVSCQNLCCYYS